MDKRPLTAWTTVGAHVTMWDMPDTVIVIANGDLRLSANQKCWPAQAKVEGAVMDAIRREGRQVRRGRGPPVLLPPAGR